MTQSDEDPDIVAVIADDVAADTVCSHLERVGQLTAAGQKFDSSFLAAL